MNILKNKFKLFIGAFLCTSGAMAQTTVPPTTWQEHWFDHNQVVTRMYYDDDVAVYFDSGVNTSNTWMYSYMGDLWRYVKQTYGPYSEEGRLYAIFHTGRYSGGHPSTYFDASHDYRDVIDAGAGPWPCDCGTNLDLVTHEVGHIVEGATMGIKESPAFGIWGDSKWAEIFIYDVYLGLGRTADANRVYNDWMDNVDNFPVEGSHWFRDWFYPIYNNYGKTDVIVRYFELQSTLFPKSGNSYAKAMNWGEFVHFWSGAAHTNLKSLATAAFGWSDEWEQQFVQAQAQYPMDYSGGGNSLIDITDLGGTITSQHSDSPAAEGVTNLIDNNFGSKFLTFNPSTWVQFEADQAYTVDSYSLTSANDAAERDPLNWTLQGSNDGSSWSTIDSRSGEDFPDRISLRKYNFNNSTTYKYYRFNFNNNSGSIFQLAEIELYKKEDAPSVDDIVIQAESYSNMSGVQIESGSGVDGQSVGYIDTGDWMAYTSINIPVSGNYLVTYKAATPNSGTQISLDLNAGSIVLGSATLPNTGDWFNWSTATHTVYIEAGTYDVGVFAQVGGFNLDWIKLSLQSAANARKIMTDNTQLEVYPNPVKSQLKVKGASSDVAIYDLSGNLLIKESATNSINVDALKPGVYFLKSNNKTIKFIKQ